MPWPPPPVATGKAPGPPLSPFEHPDHHNALAEAVNELVAYVGTLQIGTGGFPWLTVGSNNLPTSVKQKCDYVCSGSNDQVEINAALLAQHERGSGSDTLGPRGGVLLVGSRFRTSDSIVMYAHGTLQGQGWGTSIEASSNFPNAAMITCASAGENNITVRDLSLNGRFSAGGQSHGIYFYGSVGGVDADMNAFPSSHPDMIPKLSNLYIGGFRQGSTTPVRHGVWMGDNVRGLQANGVMTDGTSGHGFFMSSASDAKFTACIGAGASYNNSGSNGYAGFKVGGGSNQFINCKTFYCHGVGFDVSSSRATMTLVQAQDNGREGFLISGVDFVGTHLVADSNSRLSSTAYAMKVSANRPMLNGIHISDRAQSPSRQDRGIDFTGSSDVFCQGIVSTPTNQDMVLGTPGGSSYVRILRRNSTLYSIG
jgi:hypothetical protein